MQIHFEIIGELENFESLYNYTMVYHKIWMRSTWKSNLFNQRNLIEYISIECNQGISKYSKQYS